MVATLVDIEKAQAAKASAAIAFTEAQAVPSTEPFRKAPCRCRDEGPEDTNRIARENRFLAALSQASMALVTERPDEELMEFILELVFSVFRAERGFLMLTKGDGDDLEIKALRFRSTEPRHPGDMRFSRSIAEKVLREKRPILTRDAMTDPHFSFRQSIVTGGIRSAMCVPLWSNKEVSGLIYVDSRLHKNIFTEDDLTVLASLANVAAAKLENTQLMRQKREKEIMDRELDKARRLQEELLPRQAPHVEGWDIAGTNTPCHAVGGDYFDFIVRPAGKLAFAVGDVSGKGPKAAMMMMVLRATVHSVVLEAEMSSILAQTNRAMYYNSEEPSYATFFLGDLEPSSGDLRYVNAGHLPPILYRRSTGELEQLMLGGTVLGLFEETGFEEGHIRLEPGDVLTLFTDGVSESWSEDDEEFGIDRVADIVRKHAAQSAQRLLEIIQAEVDRFTKGRRPTDDRTLIVVKRDR